MTDTTNLFTSPHHSLIIPNSHIITAKIKIKVFILTQTTTDYLDDCNEKTIIVGVYDKKEKAEWIIECEIEQHPYATDKTSNSYRTMRFESFNNKQSIIERTFVEFNIQECEVL